MFIPLFLALAQTSFPSINKLPLPASATKFDFVALGDNRPAGVGLPVTPVFREILKEVEMIKPTFILSSGDLVYGNEEPLDTYKHELDDMTGILGKLDIPFFNAPGNHEMAQKPDFIKEYASRFGPLYGSFNYGGWEFVALVTDRPDKESSLTESEIADLGTLIDGGSPTCVFMHHPVFARETNKEDGATVEQAAMLHDLFKGHNVKAVFEGHDHVYNHQQHDGVDYYIAGGAGAPLDAPPQGGGFFHYVIVHIDGDKISTDVIPVGSLVVEPLGADWAVSDYSDYDIQARNIMVTLKDKPSSVVATLVKKKGPEPIDAQIVSTEQTADGWLVHVSLLVSKHRKTMLHFS
jgi:hypothetical protein